MQGFRNLAPTHVLMATVPTSPALTKRSTQHEAAFEDQPLPAASTAEEPSWAEREHREDDEDAMRQPLRHRLLLSIIYLRAWIYTRWRGLRSWKEFVDHAKFVPPASKVEAFERARINLVYFRSNYYAIAAVIVAYAILTNLFFFFAMAFSFTLYKLYELYIADGSDLRIGTRVVKPIEAYAVIFLTTLFLFWFSGGSSLVFWVVTSCSFVILAHASLREAAVTQTEANLGAFEEAYHPAEWV
eukprot:Sspe_Gene.115814::Locus_103946_Transcript_1_1_Confidence_1.000_Length_1666::g.115814::m.115814/K20359/RABAC1, PRAF1; PRA1 family protein 1